MAARKLRATSAKKEKPQFTHEVVDPTTRIHGKDRNKGDKLTLTDAQARLYEHQNKIKRL